MANSHSSFVTPNHESSRFTDKFHRCLGHVRTANAKRGTDYEPYGVCTASIGYVGSYKAGHRRGARTPAGRARRMREFNSCHSPEDGRFCSDPGVGRRVQTQSPEFRQWFKGSVLINRDGSPMVLYHATNHDISAFRPFTHVGTAEAANDRYRSLVRLDDQINTTTGSYRRPVNYRTYPVYVHMTNPLRMPDLAGISESGEALSDFLGHEEEASARGWEGEEAIATTLLEMGVFTIDDFEDARSNYKALKRLRRMGYDGIVYENVVEDKGSDSYIVFSPRQIKSASGNSGRFSRRRNLSESRASMTERFGVTEFEPGAIGFSPAQQKWYGWSHRAVAGFGVGSKVRRGDVIATDFPVGFTATSLADAKRMAVAFAKGVS